MTPSLQGIFGEHGEYFDDAQYPWVEKPLDDFWTFEGERGLRSVDILSDRELKEIVRRHNKEIDVFNKRYRYFQKKVGTSTYYERIKKQK